ncbi:c-type cytochrome [Marinigracilibium pacificum]|uniref:Cytochrome c n=1 Tax=Marinigracilibium pacificum TaxID=2729599 RepID=A0A848J042_9BACT|nr:c-type cytochrome [Marinigracilibium pacificum]NMM47844.1 cytochrome c [Marinigracilibium pacificum]
MKTTTTIAALICGFMIYSCNSDEHTKEATLEKVNEPKTMLKADPVVRGAYLVNTNGCNDCHSPKVMTENGVEVDESRMLSGHPANEKLAPYDEATAKSYILFSPGLTAATGPWGTSFAANLTPHETGLGTWTEGQFLTAIRKGLYKGIEGSRPLLPPMPWQHYRNFTDDDLKAIFAYLQSLNPVDNIVPEPIPPKVQ